MYENILEKIKFQLCLLLPISYYFKTNQPLMKLSKIRENWQKHKTSISDFV